jgi:O-antigen ligase
MATIDLQLPAISNSRSWLGRGLWVGVLGAGFFLVTQIIPSDVLTTDVPAVGAAAAALAVLLFVTWSRSRARGADKKKIIFTMAIVVWWFLLVSEDLFYRITKGGQILAGSFTGAAYDEAATWMIALGALLFVTFFRPQSLSRMFSGSYKWVSWFALLALASVPLSPGPLYSLAWAAKLAIAVLLLGACLAGEHDIEDVVSFLWATFWGFVLLTIIPMIQAITSPTPGFTEGGRLSMVSTNGVSAVAGTLVLIALTLYSLKRRWWVIAFGVLGVAVMILAAGKAGIISGIISAALFFLFQKRVASSLGVLIGIAAIGILLISVTPLGRYFSDYSKSGQGSTISGRTELWKSALPAAMASPILGHGYVASRFASTEEEESAVEDAGHLHNGFLEAFYNNGLIGLVLLLLIHFSILRNLLYVAKHPISRGAYLLAIGCSAVYANLLLNGMFNASFGGHAYAPFMLFLALVLIAEKLRGANESQFRGDVLSAY